MYTIEAEYTNTEDESRTDAESKGTSITELYKDIQYFLEKKEYWCWKCNKTHKIKLKSITINFKTE